MPLCWQRARIVHAIGLYIDAGWSFEKVKETALKNDNFLKILADKAQVSPDLVKACVFDFSRNDDEFEDD